MRIRDYRSDDRAALRGLMLELHALVRRYDRDLVPGDEFVDRYLEQLLAKQAGTAGAVLLAEAPGDELVGFVVLYGRLHPPGVDERVDPFAWVAELYVIESCRGQGLGEALLARAEAHARDLGVYKIELAVVAGNRAARRFYERRGYRDRSHTMTKRLR